MAQTAFFLNICLPHGRKMQKRKGGGGVIFYCSADKNGAHLNNNSYTVDPYNTKSSLTIHVHVNACTIMHVSQHNTYFKNKK
jgi:hypothetical protein